MERIEIRMLKRSITQDRDAEAMTILLERSVRFGHKRLALSRCIQAERIGISIAPEILSYCQEVADRLPPDVLVKIIDQARA